MKEQVMNPADSWEPQPVKPAAWTFEELLSKYDRDTLLALAKETI